VVRLSALSTGRFYPQEYPGTHFRKAESTPGTWTCRNLVLWGFNFETDLQETELRAWMRFMWFRTCKYGGMFCTHSLIFLFRKMWVIYKHTHTHYVAEEMTNCSVGPIFPVVNHFMIFQNSSKFLMNITCDNSHYDRQFNSKHCMWFMGHDIFAYLVRRICRIVRNILLRIMGVNFRMPDTRHIPALKACVFAFRILKSIDDRRNRKHPRIQPCHCREAVYGNKYE
jgi:hypothetical protein